MNYSFKFKLSYNKLEFKALGEVIVASSNAYEQVVHEYIKVTKVNNNVSSNSILDFNVLSSMLVTEVTHGSFIAK